MVEGLGVISLWVDMDTDSEEDGGSNELSIAEHSEIRGNHIKIMSEAEKSGDFSRLFGLNHLLGKA